MGADDIHELLARAAEKGQQIRGGCAGVQCVSGPDGGIRWCLVAGRPPRRLVSVHAAKEGEGKLMHKSPTRERRCRPTLYHASPAERPLRLISGQAVTVQNRRCSGMACVVVAIVVAAELLTTVEPRQSGW